MAETLVDVVAKLRERGKGSTTETPMRHKNGFKTSLPIFFFFFLENAKNLDRSDDAKLREKKRYGLSD